ncbi:MAG: peptidoglycan DD-metalloendopeptidase family protein [Campylobacterota bacterium]|nr:peptidoglycan DD-metalloendopeptidase family protein [Campylobacterota bacterium]
MSKVLFALLSVLNTLCLFALPQQALVPGGVAVIEIDDYKPGTKISFNGKKTTLFEEDGKFYALAGISLGSKPGSYKISIADPSGKKASSSVNVIEKKYEEQHLTIKNKRKVNPNSDDMERIGREGVIKKKAKNHWSDMLPDVSFVWPTEGRISSVFGLRRFFNEQERRPHSGLDIAAPEGTPIIASADGTVLETGDFFFSGNMIFIDHGHGLVTLYAHLSRIDVKAGQKVKKGELIGAVGETGRVTGPHLHFSVLINSVSVEPTCFLPEHHSKIAKQ